MRYEALYAILNQVAFPRGGRKNYSSEWVLVLCKFVITGGQTLRGELTVSGSKNAALPIVSAAILAEGPCTIENIPDIADVQAMLDILRKLGAVVEELDRNTIRIDATKVSSHEATFDLVSKLRGSYYLMGAFLGRFGQAVVSLPGGCKLGTRPIDQHLKGFQALGVDIEEAYGKVTAKAYDESGLLHGNNIYLDVVSVGATINLMLAACKAAGQTVIENCAREPHVVDVANFLNSMGAKIRGAGTDIIKITGVPKLHGVEMYSIIPDQIEAGTYMIAAAATGGEITIKNIIPRHQESLTAKLQEMSIGVEEGEDWIRIYNNGSVSAAHVKTLPYPGFPTDMQPQITVLLSRADGTSKIVEGVTDFRFQYTEELKRMGADITVNGKMAMVSGPKSLKGTIVRAPDLRGGAALVIAALMAEGDTVIQDVQFIDRGYDNIVGKLQSVGARIVRVEDDN